MKFLLNKDTQVAKSECGLYEIRGALNNGKMWWNAHFLPTSRSIEGTYEKDQAKRACEAHAARMARLKAEVSGVK